MIRFAIDPAQQILAAAMLGAGLFLLAGILVTGWFGVAKDKPTKGGHDGR